jgi:hypothetical protein
LATFINSHVALKGEITSQAYYLSFSDDKLLALKNIDLIGLLELPTLLF